MQHFVCNDPWPSFLTIITRLFSITIMTITLSLLHLHRCMYQLGLRYQSGQGVAANESKATDLLQRAIEAGHAPGNISQTDFSVRFLHSFSTPGKCYLWVILDQWFNKWSCCCCPTAMFALALIYERKANRLHKQAAERGHVAAKERLKLLAQ
jgi:TPR repeat protein